MQYNTVAPVVKTTRSLLVATVTILLTIVLVTPAFGANSPPPAPDNWTGFSLDLTFHNQTNPCTGEEGTTHYQSRVNHIMTHADGGTTWRRYVNETTSDGWSTKGWIHSETVTRIFPDGGVINMRELVIPLYENEGNRVMFARHTQRYIDVGGEIIADNSGFELWCAGN